MPLSILRGPRAAEQSTDEQQANSRPPPQKQTKRGPHPLLVNVLVSSAALVNSHIHQHDPGAINNALQGPTMPEISLQRGCGVWKLSWDNKTNLY
jgi:hypothetical protein